MSGIELSVGIPSYNQEQWIGKTIESVLAQTVPPLEIVVSENHSTDGTCDVLRSFRSQIRVVRPKTHLPMATNWNYLCSQLRGSWFSLLSSDDIARPRYVGNLLSAASSVHDAVLARSDYERIDENGDRYETVKLKRVQRVTRSPKNFLEQLRFPKTSFASFALRKDAWLKAGRFREDMSLQMDWAMWLAVAQFGSFVYVPEVLSEYRSSYRPDIERERIIARIRDEVKIAREVIPGVAVEMGLASHRRVLSSSRRRLWGLIYDASRVLAPAERAECARMLADWASFAGLTALLRRFEGGRPMRKRPNLFRQLCWQLGV